MSKKCRHCAARQKDEHGEYCEYLNIRLVNSDDSPVPCE